MLRSLATGSAAAWALLLVTVGAVSAAGDGTAPDDSAPSGSVPATLPADERAEGAPPEDLELQIDIMLGLLPDDQMEAYYREQEVGHQLAIQQCMNEAGFEYNPEDPGTMSADPLADLSPVEYAEQWGFGVYTMMDPENSPYTDLGQDYEWPNQEIVDALSTSEQNAWFEVNNRCTTDAYMEDDLWRNPMVQQSIADFYADVDNDPRTRDAVTAWVACMEEAGHPFASQEDMQASIVDEELQNEFYETAAWEPDSPSHAEWTAMVEQEIGIAVADANCSPALDEARDEVAADLRPALVEVWQTIDWSLPPVTVPGDGEIVEVSGEPIDGPAPPTT
jgi:hypothetical protein